MAPFSGRPGLTVVPTTGTAADGTTSCLREQASHPRISNAEKDMPSRKTGPTNMASQPMCDPVTDPLLTPENSALVVIDYQPSQTQTITSIDRDLLVRNIVSVARLAKT